MTAERVALLIDGDNIPACHSQTLMRIARKQGRVVFSRAYINGSAACHKWRSAEDVDVFISAADTNASDFRLSFEAIELEMRGGCDRFVIASNDSDLGHVVRWLLEKGRAVTVVGTDKMSARMRSVTDDPVMLSSNRAAPAPPRTASAEKINAHIMGLIRDNAGAVMLSELGSRMRSAHGITCKDTGRKNWLGYLKGRPDLFTLTGESQTLAVKRARRG